MPRDAEAWLAERGIEREPLIVETADPAAPAADPAAPTGAGTSQPPEAGPAGQPDVGPREAVDLARQSEADRLIGEAEGAATPRTSEPRLEDEVADAVAFVRRSTSGAPQAEGRLRGKLRDKGWAPAVIDQALERARREGLVDDAAMAAALVEERRAKGHAPARIRRDLRRRGFEDDVLDRHLAAAEAEDPEAAAFAVAQRKAAGSSGADAETAFRRVAAYVARRGYPEGLARKVAREAVFAARDDERTAGH